MFYNAVIAMVWQRKLFELTITNPPLAVYEIRCISNTYIEGIHHVIRKGSIWIMPQRLIYDYDRNQEPSGPFY